MDMPTKDDALRTELDAAFHVFEERLVENLLKRLSTRPPPAPAPRSAPNPKRRAAKTQPRRAIPPPPPPPAPARRRTPALLADQTFAVIACITKHSAKGVRAMQIAEECGIARDAIGVPLAHAVTSGLVRLVGKRGGARYYPASKPAP